MVPSSIDPTDPETKQENKLAAALDFAARGIPVFALPAPVDGRCNCGRPEDCGKDSCKHTLRGSAGFKDATTDPVKLRKMFDPNGPPRNIGIRTGEVSGITVIDIDNKPGKPGIESWQRLTRDKGEPQTRMARTPSGGIHVWFKYNSALGTCVDFWPGIDIRNDDAYVLVAPSATLVGSYSWMEGATELQNLPAYLTRKESQGGKFNGRKPSMVAFRGMLKFIPNDDRDKWLGVFRIAGFTYDRNHDAFQIVKEWNVGYSGKRSPGDEEREHNAFYEDSQSAVGEKQTIGTLIRWAKQGGWKPEVGTIANLDAAMSVIEADPDFCPVWWDEFHQRMFTGDPPREWDDQGDLELTRAFQRDKSLPKMSLEIVQKAVTMIAHANPRNQVRDWFDGLVWDGIERLVTFFIQFCHAEDSAYIRKVGLNFFIAMVARVYRPGCQVDHVPVLEGSQGIGKSQLVRAIGGPWFAEQHENVFSKDFHLGNQGKLVVEIGELHAFRRDIEKVKQVITAVTDRYREPYGRRATDHPRQCVFVGTTNRSDWLTDETGGRRFWPIACRGAIDVEGVRKNREQLFAEAVHRYQKNESWWEMPIEETLKQQAERYTAPAWAETIEWYITHDTMDPRNEALRKEPLKELTVADVLERALGVHSRAWTKGDEMRVGEALVYLGWEKKRPYRNGRYPVIWFPKASQP